MIFTKPPVFRNERVLGPTQRLISAWPSAKDMSPPPL